MSLSTAQNPRGALEGNVCTFGHFMNLMWQPVLEFITKLLEAQQKPSWTPAVQKNHEALLQEMDGTIVAPDACLPMDEWFEFVSGTLQRMAGIPIPMRLIKQVLSSIVPHSLEPTRANAMHLLRSTACKHLVGPTMATQVSRLVTSEIAEVPAPLLTAEELMRGTQSDLVSTLEQLQCPTEDLADEEVRPMKKARRDQESIKAVHVCFLLLFIVVLVLFVVFLFLLP